VRTRLPQSKNTESGTETQFGFQALQLPGSNSLTTNRPTRPRRRACSPPSTRNARNKRTSRYHVCEVGRECGAVGDFPQVLLLISRMRSLSSLSFLDAVISASFTASGVFVDLRYLLLTVGVARFLCACGFFFCFFGGTAFFFFFFPRTHHLRSVRQIHAPLYRQRH
jgi:hypothetical protein